MKCGLYWGKNNRHRCIVHLGHKGKHWCSCGSCAKDELIEAWEEYYKYLYNLPWWKRWLRII